MMAATVTIDGLPGSLGLRYRIVSVVFGVACGGFAAFVVGLEHHLFALCNLLVDENNGKALRRLRAIHVCAFQRSWTPVSG
jgi:hypothetical protein